MSAHPRLPVEIRVLERKDLESALAIDAGHSGRRRDQILKRRFEQIFEPGRVMTSLAAEWHGELVGFVLGDVLIGEFGSTDQSATIDTIGVRREFQGSGVAQRLLHAYVNNVRALGVERIQTQVAVSNSGLLGFFSRVGFRHAQSVPLELDLDQLRPGQWDGAEEETEGLESDLRNDR
jgi:ribosomal protein S18 acetylase RimI-like enzyme